MDNEYALLLGEIKGQLGQVIANQKTNDDKLNERLDSFNTRFDGFDTRLRTVEVKAAVTGAVSGAVTSGIVSIAIALAMEKLKTITGIR
jgi:hypothetical protein